MKRLVHNKGLRGGSLALLFAAAFTNPSQLKYNANQAGSVSRKVSDKLSDVISVKDFGAVGDGVADDTAAIQAAVTACAAPGCSIYLPTGTYVVSSTINITASGVSIIGGGRGSTINVNFAGDVFNVTGPLFRLADLEVAITYNLTRATGSVVVGGANQGSIINVRFTGNTTTPNNGIVFKSTTNGLNAGGWFFYNVRWPGGTTWSNFALITNGSITTTATGFFFTQIYGGATVTDAAFALDGMIDTVKFTSIDVPLSAGGPVVWVRNTVGGPVEFPRWTHIANSSFEAAGNTCLRIDAGKDTQYNGGYCATATTGVSVGTSSLGAKIDGVVFSNIGQSAVTVASGAVATSIINNYFDDTANSLTNTFDTVSIAANTNSFTVAQNHWRNVNPNKPRYGINVLAGTSDRYSIIGNDLSGTFGTATMINSGTGSNQIVLGNNPVGAGIERIQSAMTYNGASTFQGGVTFASATGMAASQPFQVGSVAFASLGASVNGTVFYCSDCTLANPCAGLGTGALAKRLAGVWVCN